VPKSDNEVWKWLAASLVSVILGLGGYAWGMSDVPSRAEVELRLSESQQPIVSAIQELKVELKESRTERSKMRAALATLTAQLAYLERERNKRP